MPTNSLEHVRQLAEAYASKHQFLAGLGITVETVEVGEVTTSIPPNDDLINPSTDDGAPAAIHCGALATLVDYTAGLTILTSIDCPHSNQVITTNLNLTYLRAAAGRIRARGRTVRTNGMIGVAEVRLETKGGIERMADGADCGLFSPDISLS